jgi:two-component system NtrC family response regulator
MSKIFSLDSSDTKGNKTEAARLLKIGLTTLYRKIEEYGI